MKILNLSSSTSELFGKIIDKKVFDENSKFYSVDHLTVLRNYIHIG